jgi:acetyl-CoA carboxylase, biotin carboxylase subunit
MSRGSFKKILIANRGEVAVRIIRACRELQISPVAVYSDADRSCRHVWQADEAYRLGGAPASESYLSSARIVEVARAAGVDAVHPGYGFLAENAAFALACQAAGLVFIGPKPETISLMGEKTSARRAAIAVGVPVVPGTTEPSQDVAVLQAAADAVGYPIMLKPAAGGGGKGMHWVADAGALAPAVERARREAQGAFGDAALYVEKALTGARHIEIQILADSHGNVVHLFERECSIQRRHQKIIEESPSPAVSPTLRERLGTLAVALARQVGYVNAGTLEFLLDEHRNPHFLEMNTRLQVEHAVTERVTGEDLVKLQIRIAAGEPLPFTQADLQQRGHAIECRVYAEDPDNGFLPSPGRITSLRLPGGPGVRDDSGIYEGYEVPIHYDPLLSKLTTYGYARNDALLRMRRALSEYQVGGIVTNLSFLERIVADPAFGAGDFDTGFVERVLAADRGAPSGPAASHTAPWEMALAAAAVAAFDARRAGRTATNAAAVPAWLRAGWDDLHGGRMGGR